MGRVLLISDEYFGGVLILYVLIHTFKEDVTREKLIPTCLRAQAAATAHSER